MRGGILKTMSQKKESTVKPALSGPAISGDREMESGGGKRKHCGRINRFAIFKS